MVEFLTTLGVVVSVATGCIAIVRPVIKLSTTITQLNDNIESLSKDYKETMKKNSDARKRIWNHNDEQDEILSNHELRISILERSTDDGKRD